MYVMKSFVIPCLVVLIFNSLLSLSFKLVKSGQYIYFFNSYIGQPVRYLNGNLENICLLLIMCPNDKMWVMVELFSFHYFNYWVGDEWENICRNIHRPRLHRLIFIADFTIIELWTASMFRIDLVSTFCYTFFFLFLFFLLSKLQ